MFSFSDNHKSIKEINTMFSSGSLIVDESYQRRSVWGEKDKIRLIETILLKLVIPEVFFWKAETDPETGESVTHIVDGQQRIKAISSFIDNDYKLKSQYLLDEEIKEKYGNKFFKDLDPEVKTAFWNYRLMIIEISQESTKEEIVQVFRRLNLTDFNLNDQEKRNSISGDFAALARDLSENEIWEEKHLFNNTDIKEENVHFLNGNADDVDEECRAYDKLIKNAGGIDIQLLGVGRNGHIGFNEPSNHFTKGSFKVKLTESTIEANSKYFDENPMPHYALTMGVGSIMSAKKIILIATGKAKADAVKALVDGEVSPACPASILQFHHDTVIYLDKDAASLL